MSSKKRKKSDDVSEIRISISEEESKRTYAQMKRDKRDESTKKRNIHDEVKNTNTKRYRRSLSEGNY